MKKSIADEPWKWVFYYYAQLLCYVEKKDEEKVDGVKNLILADSYLSQALHPILIHFKLIEEEVEQKDDLEYCVCFLIVSNLNFFINVP